MKIHVDFITNSSSASFVILKQHLTQEQIQLIYHHIEVSHLFSSSQKIYNSRYDQWNITELDDRIEGYTSMDNFDMLWFLEKIGVNPVHVKYERD